MPWQLTILIHSLLSGLRTTQNRRIGKYRKDVSAYVLVASFTCVFIVGLVIALFGGGAVNHSAAWSARFYLLFGGLLFATLNLLNLHLLRLVPASIAVIMALMSPVSVAIIAATVTGESLTSKQLIGAVILLGSVLLVKLTSKKKGSLQLDRNITIGLLISVVIAILYGTAVVNEKYLLDRLTLDTYVLYGWGAQFMAALSIGLLFRNDFKGTQKRRVHFNVWLSGFILAISGLFFVLTLVSSDSASLTSISSSSRVISAMILAYIFLKERDSMKVKVVAFLTGSIGLFLLFS